MRNRYNVSVHMNNKLESEQDSSFQAHTCVTSRVQFLVLRSISMLSDHKAEFHVATERVQIDTMSSTTRALDWRGRGADVDALLAHVDQLQDGEVRVSTGSFEKSIR